ncbi:uncharacterized protein LOC110018981 [Phalaenopsis equestris]|uniref:uncharacterized protein LOC110018981 n=1 Tax=Phalaenopsis equestris TaxID=78828 RepID=UPI0009E23273|nr:uncharacterized protein LOC110018981 [Phalaenopsis equestris]
MDIVFNHMLYWLLGTEDHEITNSALNSSLDFPSRFLEPNCVQFLTVNGVWVSSSSRRFRRERWEERRAGIDREYDAVIVPSDGGCLSGLESDDSDWSIGWLEPRSSNFQSEADDDESSFIALVLCYGRGRHSNGELLEKHVLGVDYEFLLFKSCYL